MIFEDRNMCCKIYQKLSCFNGFYLITNCKKVEEFKYLVTTLTNQSSIPEEIKSRLRSGIACYHSVQNLLSSRLLSKNLKIKIYRNIILPVVLYGCKTWSLTLREERRLKVFEDREKRFQGSRENYTMRSLMIWTSHIILFGLSNGEEWDGRGM